MQEESAHLQVVVALQLRKLAQGIGVMIKSLLVKEEVMTLMTHMMEKEKVKDHKEKRVEEVQDNLTNMKHM